MHNLGLYIGIMSGTSMDSIDATCIDFGKTKPGIVGSIENVLSRDIVEQLIALREGSNNQLEQLALLDREMGVQFANAALMLLDTCNLKPPDISAIGCHGQTVLHRSNSDGNGFSLQIGDPNTIAYLTHIPTVADFRRKDIAAGGEGAPLASAFHSYYFSQLHTIKNSAILNLGGIANITWLNSNAANKVIGFDCGPANALLDAFYSANQKTGFDRDSQWAKQGNVNELLLNQLISQSDYFKQPPPKSTGKELFNPDYIHNALNSVNITINAVDIQRTLLQFSIETICMGLKQCPGTVDSVYCCGGGADNSYFLELLQQKLTAKVTTTDDLGVPAKQVEAFTFAWLAKQRLEGATGNLCSVTGARQPVVLGGVYLP